MYVNALTQATVRRLCQSGIQVNWNENTNRHKRLNQLLFARGERNLPTGGVSIDLTALTLKQVRILDYNTPLSLLYDPS